MWMVGGLRNKHTMRLFRGLDKVVVANIVHDLGAGIDFGMQLSLQL